VPLALSACGNSDSSTSATEHLAVAISDAGCDPATATVKAGKVTFDVTNQGSSKVTEFYVKNGDNTIGEVENVVPGSPKKLTLTLKAGTYTTRCPNGTTTEEGVLDVVSTRSTTSVTGANQPSGSIAPNQPGGDNSGGGVQPGSNSSPNATTAP
jgi:iron uptake system EfeUOB component EfeO/EfeM